MKRKLLIGLAVFVLFIISTIGIVFTLTAGLPKLANEMLELVAQGKVEEAYNTTTSKSFQQITTLDEFTYFLEGSRLNLYTGSTWNYREITGGSGYIEGTVTLSDGSTLPMVVDFVKEEGEWKIYGVDVKKSVADLFGVETGEIPSEEELITLANGTMSSFADAVEAQDFTAFYDTIGQVWKIQTNPEQIEAAFAVFFEEGFDFQYTKTMNPTFTVPAYFDDENALSLEGNYTNADYQTDFIFQYFLEEGEYKLVGLDVYQESLKAPLDVAPADNSPEITDIIESSENVVAQ